MQNENDFNCDITGPYNNGFKRGHSTNTRLKQPVHNLTVLPLLVFQNSLDRGHVYLDGSHTVVRINYSLVTPVKRQAQSDGDLVTFISMLQG